MRVGTVTSIALLMLATSTAVAAEIPPVLSVDYVSAHLKELHGRNIRIQGQINECVSLTCLICSSGAKDAVCLPFSLWSEPYPVREDDIEGSARASRAGSLIEEIYRFATVTADARVDATCELGYNPDKPDPNETIVCTDRSSAIEDARVVSVDVRRAATEGSFSEYGGDALRPATEDERGPITKSWLATLKHFDPTSTSRMIEVLVRPADKQRQNPEFAVCACRSDNCSGRWPKRTGEFLLSPANPYYCYSADKFATDWTFEPEW